MRSLIDLDPTISSHSSAHGNLMMNPNRTSPIISDLLNHHTMLLWQTAEPFPQLFDPIVRLLKCEMEDFSPAVEVSSGPLADFLRDLEADWWLVLSTDGDDWWRGGDHVDDFILKFLG